MKKHIKTAKSKAKTWFGKIFHDRKILLVTGDRVSSIIFPKNLQVGLAAMALFLLFATPFAIGRLVNYIELQGNRLEMVSRSGNMADRVAALERNIQTLEGYFVALNEGSYFYLKDKNMIRRPEILVTMNEDNQQVAELEYRQKKLMAELYVDVYGKIGAIENVLDSAGVPYNKLTGKTAPTEGQGGPYVPDQVDADSEEFGKIFYTTDFAEDFRYLYELQYLVNNLPFMSPIHRPKVTSSFGYRFDPFNRKAARHEGVDLAAAKGSYIYSTAPGVVTKASYAAGYGNMVEVRHKIGGIATRYAHMSKILVKPGQVVKRGDKVGVQGSTGRSTGSHLHYEVRLSNTPVNPMKFLAQAYKVGYFYK